MSNVVTFKAGAAITPIVPTSFEDVQRMAKMAVTAGLFKGERRDSETALLGKATMALLQGLEVGLPPMQAIQQIAVINGRCVIWGDAVPALLWSRGFKLKEWTDENGTAWCTVTRPDGDEITRSFSIEEAKQARLWDERPTVQKTWDGKVENKPNDSPWFRFRPRMMSMRARGFAVRDGAPDVLRGIYIREEIDGGELVSEPPVVKQSLTTAPLELPDIPDEPQEVEGIAGPAALIEKIKEDIELARADGVDVGEVSEQYADLIERLPDDWKGLAYQLFEAAA